MNIIWGLFGCSIIILITLLMSENRKAINIRTVTIGFILQIIFGFLVLKWDYGMKIISAVSNAITEVMNYGYVGLEFAFGPLAENGSDVKIWAVTVLGMIVFFTVLIALFYYFGIMQIIVRVLGGGISKMMKTSYSESVAAAANMFIGSTQAPLVIKPYVANMTRSQLYSLMVGSLASVSGAVMIGLAAMGIPMTYLLSAAVMSAPAGLMIAKLIIPETKEINEDEWKLEAGQEEEKTNVIDVIFTSSREGLRYAINVGLMIVIFISLVALINGLLGWTGSLFGFDQLSLELIFGYVFAPVAFVIGIPWDEAVMAGNYLAQKLFLNEFVAFTNLTVMMDELSEKTLAILTFALSGFANFGAAGSLVGMLLEMVPDKKTMIQKMMFKALIAATLANLLNGAIVTMFF